MRLHNLWQFGYAGSLRRIAVHRADGEGLGCHLRLKFEFHIIVFIVVVLVFPGGIKMQVKEKLRIGKRIYPGGVQNLPDKLKMVV